MLLTLWKTSLSRPLGVTVPIWKKKRDFARLLFLPFCLPDRKYFRNRENKRPAEDAEQVSSATPAVD